MPTCAGLLQDALAPEVTSANTLTASGLAALFAEVWFPSLAPGFGAAGNFACKFTFKIKFAACSFTYIDVTDVIFGPMRMSLVLSCALVKFDNSTDITVL